MNSSQTSFSSAQPVWPTGRENERNTRFIFTGQLSVDVARHAAVRLTGSSLYRLKINGKFTGHGPARAAHVYYRIDEWVVTDLLNAGENTIEIEVAGYNVNSFYLLNQPAFLQCEVVIDGDVKLATEIDGGFVATELAQVIQRVQRFSFQRPFIEAYRLSAHTNAQPLLLSNMPMVSLLKRGYDYPTFHTIAAERLHATCAIAPKIVETFQRDRSLTDIGPNLLGYPMSELEVIATDLFQSIKSVPTKYDQPINSTLELLVTDDIAHVVKLPRNLSGFVGCTIRCDAPGRLGLLWDEISEHDDVRCLRTNTANLIYFELQPGVYHFESFEPYTMQFIKLLALDGKFTISNVYLREYASPSTDRASFTCDDFRLNAIFNAAVQTLRQNAPDLLTDCPSRERAGWLCDSFFSSRAAYFLTGNTRLERCFLENYLLAPVLPQLPAGMVAPCYPADLYDGLFIPQWSLWLILQLHEYRTRSGDKQMIEAFRPKLMALLEYFRPFENHDGLLEKLTGWNFVEWSPANDFVHDVNYPTNMLYATALDALDHLYELPALADKARAIRQVVVQQSFDGTFFVDNAIRINGKLVRTTNRTETCQYFAFYFGVATRASHAELWNTLVIDFGPSRQQTKAFPEVHASNMIIGNYLRLELLSRAGLIEKIHEEVCGYFLQMTTLTGTLWENNTSGASCNHGFASHAAVSILRDLAGLHVVDHVNLKLLRHPPSVKMQFFDAHLPAVGGCITVSKNTASVHESTSVPHGYSSAY